MKLTASHGALCALALSTLVSALGMSSASIALPTLAQAFDASVGHVQWVLIAYLLAVTTLIVSAGRLGDIAARRRLLLAGIALFTAGSCLSGLAPSLGLLIAARAVQGLGAALMMALGMAFVGEVLPKDRTGSAMGVLGTMSAVGTALGPSLGGMLIHAQSWRAIFLVNVPLGLLALALAWRFLPADRARPASAGVDLPGMLLLALTLLAYALAMTAGGAATLPLLCGAALGLILFIAAELGAATPMVQLAMFRDLSLSASLVMSLLVSTVMMTTLVVGPFYLAHSFGLDAAGVGLVLSAGPLAAALAGIPAGRLVDRHGAAITGQAGLAGLACAAWALSCMPPGLGIPGYLACIIGMTISFSLFQTANNTAVMAAVAPDRRGVVSGLLNLSRNLGLMSGASVMGTVYATAGLRVTFSVAAMLIVVAFAAGAAALLHARKHCL